MHQGFGNLQLEAFFQNPALDGFFWLAHSKTGVFCRTSCQANRSSNAFEIQRSIDEARKQNLEPCPKCKPEKHWDNFDKNEHAAFSVYCLLEHCLATIESRECFEKLSGFSSAKLEHLCLNYYQQSFSQLLWKLALQTAQTLLKNGKHPKDLKEHIALAQHAKFEQVFQQRTGLTIAEYSELNSSDNFQIALPKSFRPDLLAPYWTRDSHDLTMKKREGCFLRSFSVGDKTCVVEGVFKASHFNVAVAWTNQAGDRFDLHYQICRILGLGSDPDSFEEEIKRRKNQALITSQEGLRVTMTPNVYEALVWTIIGQQINLNFAYRLRNRLIRLAGKPLSHGLYAHPTPAAVAELCKETLLEHQFSRRKAEYLTDVSKRIYSGDLPLEDLGNMPYPVVARTLMAERGIGIWTTRYLAMRGYGFPNCAPVGDAGLRKALKLFFKLEKSPNAQETEDLMVQFSPYQSLATFHFWRSLA